MDYFANNLLRHLISLCSALAKFSNTRDQSIFECPVCLCLFEEFAEISWWQTRGEPRFRFSSYQVLINQFCTWVWVIMYYHAYRHECLLQWKKPLQRKRHYDFHMKTLESIPAHYTSPYMFPYTQKHSISPTSTTCTCKFHVLCPHHGKPLRNTSMYTFTALLS